MSARPAGSGTPGATSATCSRGCLASPATTSGCASWLALELADRGAGPGHLAAVRRCLGGGLHPGGVRPVEGDGAAVGPGRLGRVRVLRPLRLHLLCTLHGLPAGFALTGA